MRLPRVLEFLGLHAPDVLCLQETKVAAAAFPAAELEAAGYGAVQHSAGRWAGVAVLAREGLELSDVAHGLAGEPDPAEARWIEAEVGGLRVVSAYVPNGRSLDSEFYAAKLAFLAAARERVAELAERPLLLVGDLNVAPADLDVYDPAAFAGSTHVSAAERSAVASLGLVDVYRALHPDEPGFTWWDYRQGHFHRKLGLRIDLVLATEDVAARATSCGIDRDFRKGPKPSDHAPLLVRVS